MKLSAENIFTGFPPKSGEERFLTLFQSKSVKIERIVSRSHASPPGFWYDQVEDEWVMVLRGRATLEFEDGALLEMEEGDYLAIRSHVKHRIAQTAAQTIWLAVRADANRPAEDPDRRPL
jgi:cupin 2 domain-containing protein